MSTHQLKIIFFAVIASLTSACSDPADFYYLDGREGKLTDFKGQWLLINYWAEWCKPCIEEIPEINDFHHQYNKQIAMLSISYDALTNEELQQQVEKYNIQYPLISSSPTPKLDIELPTYLPANYIISPNGKQYGPLMGPQTIESLLAAINKAKMAESESLTK